MLYWVIINNQRLGPLPVEELKNLNIQRDTLVWHEGLRDWSRAASLPELSDIVPAPALYLTVRAAMQRGSSRAGLRATRVCRAEC